MKILTDNKEKVRKEIVLNKVTVSNLEEVEDPLQVPDPLQDLAELVEEIPNILLEINLILPK